MLYALEEVPYLKTLIDREFCELEDFEQAIELISSSNGISRARDLATHHGHRALECLAQLPPSASRQALEDISEYVLRRLK